MLCLPRGASPWAQEGLVITVVWAGYNCLSACGHCSAVNECGSLAEGFVVHLYRANLQYTSILGIAQYNDIALKFTLE